MPKLLSIATLNTIYMTRLSVLKKLTPRLNLNIIIGVIWIIIFIIPVTILKANQQTDWSFVIKSWQLLALFLVLFFINHLILIPQLFFKNRRILYFGAVLLCLITLSSYRYFSIEFEKPPLTGQQHPRPPMMNDSPMAPRPEFDKPRQFNGPPGGFHLFKSINTFLLGLLVVGLDMAMVLSMVYSETEKQKARLEKENINNQLASLKHQINPHFFMNTLNNIHALIDIEPNEAKETIIKLSKLMRYMLYESEAGKVQLAKEVEFITDYINLMKIRCSDKVDISTSFIGTIPNKTIPPMLFLSLIENAFKHGISYKDHSFIYLTMMFSEERLLLELKNSIVRQPKTEYSGIGLENTRKRLDLLYGTQYRLDLIETHDVYIVNLSIPL